MLYCIIRTSITYYGVISNVIVYRGCSLLQTMLMKETQYEDWFYDISEADKVIISKLNNTTAKVYFNIYVTSKEDCSHHRIAADDKFASMIIDWTEYWTDV